MLRKGTFILMKTKIQDMTSGSPGRLIILFAIPLMLGNICQQLYTMVDTMVVGQVAGVEALAALGAVDFLMWVVTGISTGLTQGFSIQLSQYYGAKDFENLRKSLAHSYRLTAFIAAGVLILSQSFASLVLTGLHTPSNIIGMSLLYLRIIFCGIPATAAYNMFASALRAMGNSKTPLTAMIIASVLNVSLDILFVAGFGWGVAGAAIATVIAQSFSAVYCFLILRRIDIVHLTRADFMPASGMNARLMKLGIPTIDGLILDVPVKAGNSVIMSNTFNDGTTIATVANMNDLIFRGKIDETEVGRVHEGMPVKLTIGALQNLSFDAILEYISPKGVEENGANQFEIKAAIQVPDTVMIRSGYSANAEIVLERAQKALTLPESTIEFSGDSTFVYVMTDSVPAQKFERKEVKVGMSDGIKIVIKDGVDGKAKVRGAEKKDK